MTQHNVDFIGGDFNILLVMCSLIQSFRLLAIRSCGGLAPLEDSNLECAGFLILPKHPYEWYVDAHDRASASTVPQKTHPASSLQVCLYRLFGKTQRVQSPCRGSSLWCTTLLGLVHAFNMGSIKQMRVMLHNKIT